MSLDDIIQQLKAERTRIDKALAALGEISSPPKQKAAKKGKRTISPEARARIIAAQKARWAKYRKEHPKKK